MAYYDSICIGQDASGLEIYNTSSTSYSGVVATSLGDTIRVAHDRTPASASATGVKGEICWDSGYVYVCVATDTWKRAALSTW